MLLISSLRINWTKKNGEVVRTVAHPGMNLLSAARAGNIEVEGKI